MTRLELQQYLLREYRQENARCEWKEFKNLKNSFCGDEKDDVISYVSALQFIQNAGEEGTKLDAILEYIKDVLPSTKSMEQKRRLLRHILEEMKNENMILVNGRTWFENGYKS